MGHRYPFTFMRTNKKHDIRIFYYDTRLTIYAVYAVDNPSDTMLHRAMGLVASKWYFNDRIAVYTCKNSYCI